jgi:hypothetical protein
MAPCYFITAVVPARNSGGCGSQVMVVAAVKTGESSFIAHGCCSCSKYLRIVSIIYIKRNVLKKHTNGPNNDARRLGHVIQAPSVVRHRSSIGCCGRIP